MHFVLRKQCRSEDDYLNQRLLVEMLLPHQDPNAKNCLRMCPIHEVLQVPSLRVCTSDNTRHFLVVVRHILITRNDLVY